MEHIPAGKKIIEVAVYVTSPNSGGDACGHKIMLLADRTTACKDVLAIAVDAINASTGPAAGV